MALGYNSLSENQKTPVLCKFEELLMPPETTARTVCPKLIFKGCRSYTFQGSPIRTTRRASRQGSQASELCLSASGGHQKPTSSAERKGGNPTQRPDPFCAPSATQGRSSDLGLPSDASFQKVPCGTSRVTSEDQVHSPRRN